MDWSILVLTSLMDVLRAANPCIEESEARLVRLQPSEHLQIGIVCTPETKEQ